MIRSRRHFREDARDRAIEELRDLYDTADLRVKEKERLETVITGLEYAKSDYDYKEAIRIADELADDMSEVFPDEAEAIWDAIAEIRQGLSESRRRRLANRRRSVREALYTRGDFEGGTLAGNYDDYDSYSDDDYDDTDVEFEREIATYPFASAHNGYELADRFVKELESHLSSNLTVGNVSKITSPLYGDKNGFKFTLHNDAADFSKKIYVEYDHDNDLDVVVVYWINGAPAETNEIFISRNESWDKFVNKLEKAVFPTTFRESRRIRSRRSFRK